MTSSDSAASPVMIRTLAIADLPRQGLTRPAQSRPSVPVGQPLPKPDIASVRRPSGAPLPGLLLHTCPLAPAGPRSHLNVPTGPGGGSAGARVGRPDRAPPGGAAPGLRTSQGSAGR